MTFKDWVSDGAWHILRYQGVGEDMEDMFRDNPWVAVCSAVIPPVRYYVIGAEQKSRVDSLTGLLNKRAFDENLLRELRIAFRRMEPLSVTLMDVDYFKELNDVRGHREGDNALMQIGVDMNMNNRADMAYRAGGDEFAIIMPGTDLVGAMTAAERYKDRIDQSVRHYGLSVSMGIAGYVPHKDPRLARYSPGPGDVSIMPDMDVESKSLYENADKALYEAKKTRGHTDRSGICVFIDGEPVEA